MAEKLFPEFPPVPTEKWEEVITKDLKGADYEKKLVWKTQEGFSVAPYYRAENLENIAHMGSCPGSFPFVRGTKKDNNWAIFQAVIVSEDYSKANAEALDKLFKGVESIGFAFKAKTELSVEDFKTLLNEIDLSIAPVDFKLRTISISTLKNFVAYLDSANVDKSMVKASFDFNPLFNLTAIGSLCDKGFAKLKEAIEVVKDYPGIKVVSVDGYVFNNAGATLTQELAYALAIGSEYVAGLQELGLSVEEITTRMRFTLSVGSSYFMEIAKFRAARMLWANIVDAYGASNDDAKKINVHAITSLWNQTVYDAYVNMLRGTTEAMSAAIAGVDSLEVLPFDYSFRQPTVFSDRIARNVQTLLKEEALFDKVVDPSAGSYYIENLTDSLSKSTWDLFTAVENAGGFIAEFKAGNIQAEIKKVADTKEKNLATRRETLLGLNQYPNFLETAEEVITADIVSKDVLSVMGEEVPFCTGGEKVAEPLTIFRVGQAFESLRLTTDRSEKEPKAFMLTFGNLAMCRARAQFSSNFFAVAGIRVEDNNRFETIEEGVKAAIAAKADIVVACSSDDEYTEAVPQIAELLGDKAILAVAGAPACQAELEAKGITNFINVKSNVLETLKDYQQKLDIK